MRDKSIEQKLGKFLSKKYGEPEDYDWALEYCQYQNNEIYVSIYANGNDLVYLKEEIEKLPATILTEFKCISMYDLVGECRDGEDDKQYIDEIKIKSQNAAEVLNQQIDKLLDGNEFSNKLSKIFHKNFEFVEPYRGKKGDYAAEIFCLEGVEEIKSLIQGIDVDLENDLLCSDCNLDRGDIQILISSEETLNKIKFKINESYHSISRNPGLVPQSFYYYFENSSQTGNSNPMEPYSVTANLGGL